MILVLARWAAGERFLVRADASAEASNSTEDELEVLLVHVSHQVGDVALIAEGVGLELLVLVEEESPLADDQH